MIDDPYDYDDDLEDECFHDEYEIDILTGIASCDYCGLRWMLTREQFERQQELQVEYDRQVARFFGPFMDQEGQAPCRVYFDRGRY